LKEKLIIKNFGPIRHVDLDLGRFNVLIGEQATGKSTVAKVLAVCRYYSYIRPEIRIVGGLTNFAKGLEDWGLKESIEKDSHIFYENEHYSISVNQVIPDIPTGQPDKNIIDQPLPLIFQPSLTSKSEEFKNLLIAEREIFSRPRNGNLATLPPSFYRNNVASVMDNPFFLPTERGLQSVFSLGKGGIQNISDALFNQLAKLNQITGGFDSETVIEPIGVTYKNIDGRSYVKKNLDGEFHSLLNGASGYQSSIPIVLVSEYYNRIVEEVKTMIIEEPELNLFPSTQQQLMQYLVGQIVKYGNSMLLTTHSPYVLASLNNLLYAYKVGQINKEAVNAIIPEKYWLKPSEFSAYRLLNNGTCRDILDNELEEIAVEELDEAGKQINKIYDRILAIKFEK
jgi:AAA ATPase domain